MIVSGLMIRFHCDWPDYVHTDYGFPLAWATYTTSTIAGPAEMWRLNPISMVVDITVWTILSVLVVTIVDVLKRKRRTVQNRLGSSA